jgi:hypothetical protein
LVKLAGWTDEQLATLALAACCAALAQPSRHRVEQEDVVLEWELAARFMGRTFKKKLALVLFQRSGKNVLNEHEWNVKWERVCVSRATQTSASQAFHAFASFFLAGFTLFSIGYDRCCH